MRRASMLGLAWLLCWVLAAHAQDLVPVPPLSARVTDLTGTLTPDQRSTLEQQLASFEARKGVQLSVLIVPTTKPEEIEQYGIRVVEQWKLGRRNVDDGALLLIAKNDRRLRIEVGYGLEGALTDATSHRIITESITPFLRQGDFYGGVSAGLAAMMKVAGGEPLPPPDPRWGPGGQHPGASRGLPGGLIFMVLVGSLVLSAIFGRVLGSVLTAAGAGVLVAATGHAILLALLVGAGAFVFSLFLGAGRGGFWTYPRRGGFYGGGFGGFGGGGFGGGGFGGGGFGGGGGGFGGGGASGRW